MHRPLILIITTVLFLLVGLSLTFTSMTPTPAFGAPANEALATPMPQSSGSNPGGAVPIPTIPPISATLQLNSDPPSATQVKLGDKICYTLTLINRGAAITNVTVLGFAPDGTTLIPGSVTPPTSTQSSLVSNASIVEANASLTLTWQLPTLAVSQTFTSSFCVNVTLPGLPIVSQGRYLINGVQAGVTPNVNHGTPLALGESEEPTLQRFYLPMISRYR